MADCFTEDIQGLRGLSAPVRNNYFYGKLLDVQHFAMEQRYFNNKRWLLNRLGLGSGAVCGLKLAISDGKLVLAPGVAIDSLGHEITVPVAVAIDPHQISDDCGKVIKQIDSGNVTICLAYHPCATEMVPVLVSDCDTRDGCAPSTIRESFAVLVKEGTPKPFTPACAIPDLFKPPSGQAHPDLNAIYAQITDFVGRACVDASDDTCVVLGQVTLPGANEMLTDKNVQYVGRQVVLNNTLLFELLLCLWDRVEQCCAAPAPTPPPPMPTPPPPTPTPPPAQALRVEDVEFLNTRGRVVEKLTDPRHVPKFSAEKNIAAIRIIFNKPVNHNTIVAGEFNADPKKFSFLAQAKWSRFADKYVPGSIAGEKAQTVLFTIHPEFKAFRTGDYTVTLFGDKDPTVARPTITGTDGLRLDGEPLALPSGNGVEGGNFVFKFVIS